MSRDSLRFLGLDDSSQLNCECNILDKKLSAFNYIQYMFDRTNTMFRYTNLPDTIPEPMLEYMLQIYGSVAIAEVDGNLYAFRAGWGGPPDPYYRPTQAQIANPALGVSQNYRVINHLPPFARAEWDTMPDCVRFLNDSQIQGLLPLFSRYAVQMAENDVSIRSAQINLRQQTIIVASTGPEIESAMQYIKNLEDGQLSSIAKRPFLDGVTVTNVGGSNSNVIMQLLELQQYLKASWYNEIGLNSNFNMKSQYISTDEINSTADIMLPLVDNMFEQRLSAVQSINDCFGTNIIVEKDSAWAMKQAQADAGSYGVLSNPDMQVQAEQQLASSSVDSTQEQPEQDSQQLEQDSQQPPDTSSVDSTQEQSESNPEQQPEPEQPTVVIEELHVTTDTLIIGESDVESQIPIEEGDSNSIDESVPELPDD